MSDIIDKRGIPVASTLQLEAGPQWFRALLAANGVVPQPDSGFARSLAAIDNLAKSARGEPFEVPDDQFPFFLRDALGTDYIIKAMHRAHPNFEQALATRLNVFSGPDVCLMRDAQQNNERDLAWEVLVAALTASFARNVRFEEPDVLCEYLGTKWGMACKVLYSGDRDRQVDALVKGAKQLERSDADVGFIAANVTNLIEHSDFIPVNPDVPGTFGAFRDPHDAQELLRRRLADVVANVEGKSLLRRLTEDKAGAARLKTRGVLFFAQTVATVGRVPTIFSMVNWYLFRELEVGETPFVRAFNDAGQTTVLHAVSG